MLVRRRRRSPPRAPSPPRRPNAPGKARARPPAGRTSHRLGTRRVRLPGRVPSRRPCPARGWRGRARACPARPVRLAHHGQRASPRRVRRPSPDHVNSRHARGPVRAVRSRVPRARRAPRLVARPRVRRRAPVPRSPVPPSPELRSPEPPGPARPSRAPHVPVRPADCPVARVHVRERRVRATTRSRPRRAWAPRTGVRAPRGPVEIVRAVHVRRPPRAVAGIVPADRVPVARRACRVPTRG